jgi:hypothetical protein
MTEKVIDRETAGFLILIIPVAAVLVLLFTAWKWMLLATILLVAWKVWENYYWLQWSSRINPFFHALILENQGKITPMDLAIPTNMSARASEKFLEKKAAEFGAQKQETREMGLIYYFLTGKALEGIFESSQPAEMLETSATLAPASSLGKLLDLAEQKEEVIATPPQPLIIDAISEPAETPSTTPHSLSQTELAKRLETNSSTVGRRKLNPDFPLWSASKDPEGIAWMFEPETNLFVSVQEEE